MPVWQSLLTVRAEDIWEYPSRTLTSLEHGILAPTEDSLLWEILRDGVVNAKEGRHLSPSFPTIYTDKATLAVIGDAYSNQGTYAMTRAQPGCGNYRVEVYSGAYTADFRIAMETSTCGLSYLGYESIDLPGDSYHTVMLSSSGSTHKAFRSDLTAPKITVTNTSWASGRCGIVASIANDARFIVAFLQAVFTAKLRAPASPGLQALAVLEVPVENGEPVLSRDVDVERNIDRDAVTWGGFELDPRAPTGIVTVFGDNPYVPGAVGRQIAFIRSRNLKVLSPPRDYGEAVEQYRRLSRDFPGWLAGKDNYAYQTLGWWELDLFQNADFYYGELLEHRAHHDQLKQVPEHEIRRRLRELKEALSRVTALAEERDKHLQKLEEVEKKGW